MTTIVAVGTAAAVSSTIEIADGASATFSLVTPVANDKTSFASILLVQEAGQQTIGYLRSLPISERAITISGPASLIFSKGVTTNAAGVDQQ